MTEARKPVSMELHHAIVNAKNAKVSKQLTRDARLAKAIVSKM